jgi:hypothetical protein
MFPEKKKKFTTSSGGQQVPLRETLIYTVTQFVKYACSRQSNVPVATNIEARACYTSGRFDLYVQFQRQRPVILFDSFALILIKYTSLGQRENILIKLSKQLGSLITLVQFIINYHLVVEWLTLLPCKQ